MTYARSRLWLGISGVGTMVLIAVAGLLLDWPRRLVGMSDISALAWVLGAYVLVQLPFDLLGGYLLPHRFGRRAPPMSRFAASWLRGVLLQVVVMLMSALLIVTVGSAGGTAVGLASYAALMIALILVQGPLAQVVGGLKEVEARERTVSLQSDDEGFTGGIVGPPGADRILLPAHWQTDAEQSALPIAISRRKTIVASGARLRGLVWAVAWNLAGFVLSVELIPGANVSEVPGLLTLSLGMTLWSFLGLLLLPSLSRPAVLEADRATLDEAEWPKEQLQATIRSLDRLQDDEPDRPRWVERVFHPLPAVRSRLVALEQSTPARRSVLGGWHTARNSLFLSWACLGFLSRIVHCNAGRPALWVLLPSD